MEQRWGGYDFVCLNDEQEFEFLNGLWTGKKNPLIKAKVIRNTNFTISGEIDWSDIAELDVEERQLASRQLQTGDIIIERSGGGPKQPVGRVVFFQQPADNSQYSFSNFTSAIRVKNKAKINSLFLHYYLLYYYFNEDVTQHQSNTTGLRNLNFTGYKNDILIPLLTPSEQDKIIYILSSLQKAIKKHEKIINTTRALKKSLLNKLFIEGTKEEPLKQTEIGTIPESWELKKLGELCDVSSGGTPSREIGEYWTGGTIPWVKTGEINYTLIKETSEKITEIGLKNSSAKMFPAGTLLMAMYGQGITRGRVAILGIDAALNQACAAIIPFSEKEISSKYLYRYFEYQYEYIREFGHGANQKNLSGTIIKSIPIAFPKDENEQEIISTSIDAVQHKLQHHKRKKEVYEHLFKTLLNELMIGAIRVNDLQFNIKKSSDLISVQQSTKTVTA